MIATTLAAHAADHDRDGTFVDEAFDALRDEGVLAMAVPSELGGQGATIREVAAKQRELARHCGSTALASAMHQHVTCFTVWRWRRGLPGAEATLKRVAQEGIVLVSTGGADFTRPRGTAVKVEGGYRVSGRKVFCSQSVRGTVLSTMFAYDDPEQGQRILNMAVPVASDGVTVLDNWDTMGMRGTASNDIVLENVFVPEERVLANRPYGVIDPPFQVNLIVAIPIISAVYLGVAEAAYAAALEAVTSSGRVADPIVQRQVGLMRHRLRVASWALDRALDDIGDDPEPSLERVESAMIAKGAITDAGIAVCDIAMELAGGQSFFKGSVIERCYRDIRAIKFHPLTPELALIQSGQLALGQPADSF